MRNLSLYFVEVTRFLIFVVKHTNMKKLLLSLILSTIAIVSFAQKTDVTVIASEAEGWIVHGKVYNNSTIIRVVRYFYDHKPVYYLSIKLHKAPTSIFAGNEVTITFDDNTQITSEAQSIDFAIGDENYIDYSLSIELSQSQIDSLVNKKLNKISCLGQTTELSNKNVKNLQELVEEIITKI